MRVRILGAHNLEYQHTRHTCFLLDGVLAIDAGSLMTSLTRQEQLGIQAMLLTHRHIDHVRDIPSLGLATLDAPGAISLHGLPETLESISSRLMDGVLYPDFTTSLTKHGPKYRLQPVTPNEIVKIHGYSVRPIPVPHAAPTVGYIVHQAEGGTFAYCGDMGGGLLPFLRDPLKPDPIFVEITFAGRMEERAKLTGHLTPELLRRELAEAAREKLPLPRIMIVHRALDHEEEIIAEVERVASELGADITLAQEDVVVDV